MTMTAVPTPAPTKPYLRRCDVNEWLEALGIDEKVFDKLVGAGTIERVTITEGGRGYYLREAIDQHIIQPFRAAEARLTNENSKVPS